MKILFALLAFALLTLPVEFRAQTAISDRVQKGNKTFISVPVTVSDREGRYISGLKKDDFTVYQDGVKQKIEFFATESEPINVALLLDTSASTKDVLDKIREAARDFIDLMNPNDKCLIATFDSQVKVLSQFTSDKKTLKDALNQIQNAEQEGSVVFRAVDHIARNSLNNVQGRKAIVLLSDGKDFGSSVSRNELINQLEESDVLIYSVFYQTGIGFNKLVVKPDGTVKEGKENKKPKKEKKPKKKKGYSIVIPMPGDTFTQEEIKLTDRTASTAAVNSLQEMSDTTAGRFYLSDAVNLSRIFKQIAGELRQQYRLGFYTKDADSALHDLTVKVERPDVVVRARGKFRAGRL
ncbi:MAG TPA: VWA domain-containing protein [Pyrinomonadaceae bacterium]|nr:VWA domain-containing protein [Pyrinomonadaceae bacterium]